MGTRADRSPSRYPQHRHSPPQRKRHFDFLLERRSPRYHETYLALESVEDLSLFEVCGPHRIREPVRGILKSLTGGAVLPMDNAGGQTHRVCG